MIFNRTPHRVLTVFFLILIFFLIAQTFSFAAKKDKKKGYVMTEVELQSELMSYADRFASIITQAMEDFETLKPKPQARQVILSDLVYSISSIYTISDIPSELFFAAAQAGWPIDVFMRIGIQRLGTVENMSFGELPASGYIDLKTQFKADFRKLKVFERMVQLIFILGDREVIEVQQLRENGKDVSYLMFAKKVPDDLRPMVSELRQMIGIASRNRYRITDRVTHIQDDEISIQTRSDLAMMEFMARGVEVPLEHLEDGRVIDYGLQNSYGEVAKGMIPFRMRSGKSRPENVFAAIKYQGYWYYIEHNDITSKRALGLLIVLFRLQAPTPAGAAPLLSLPTG